MNTRFNADADLRKFLNPKNKIKTHNNMTNINFLKNNKTG